MGSKIYFIGGERLWKKYRAINIHDGRTVEGSLTEVARKTFASLETVCRYANTDRVFDRTWRYEREFTKEREK